MQRSARPFIGVCFVVAMVALSRPAAANDDAGAGPSAATNVLPADEQLVFDTKVRPFLKQHCFDCHGAEERKAGLRLDTLGTDFLEGKTANVWKEVVDKINLGIMPPKDEPRPNPQAAFAVVEWVNLEMRSAEKRAQSSGGRVPMRRMNRSEYANTVRDLFHLNDSFARKIERELPVEGKVDGFDRGGAALLVDKSQLQTYLDVARLVIGEALPDAPPRRNKYRIEAVNDTFLTKTGPPKMSIRDILKMDPGLDHSHVLSDEKELAREVPAGPYMGDLLVHRDGGLEIFAGRNQLGYPSGVAQSRQIVRQDGAYRLRIRAGASRGTGEYEVDAVRIRADYCEKSWNRASFTFTIDASLDQPKLYEQDIFLQSGGPDFDRTFYFRWNNHYAWNGFGSGYGDMKGVIVFDAELQRRIEAKSKAGSNYEVAVTRKDPPEKIAAARQQRNQEEENLRRFLVNFQGPVRHLRDELDLAAMPRLWYEYIELEGPYTEWPTKANQEIFFNGEAGDDGDPEYARQIFGRFLPRAYRRPVDPIEVEDLVQSVMAMQHVMGKTFAEAVRASLVTVLTSPDFLYLEEPAADDARPHELTDTELANRLSYLLWSSMPDADLLALAAQRKLHDPGVVQGQVKRMVADPKSRQFVENFVGQWLRVRDFDSVVVDERSYKTYDRELRASGQREPYEFFQELLRSDLSVLNLLDSDFVVVDQRLAKHYQIDGVAGDQFRRVAVQPDQHRGGILGMAGVLTYLSDGKRTMPVKRGAYLLDVLFNTPAPLPPPDAGDLPTVKDAKTVRDRLVQHRARDTCASCHAKIDPLGLALENFDAIGAWRERQNGEGRTGSKSDPPIDPSGVMPDGKAFATFADFKQVLWEERDRFLNAFTQRLLAYALGRPVGVTDREAVERILSAAAAEDYRLQAFLQALVAEREFRVK